MKHDNSGNIYLNLKCSNNSYVAVVLQTVDLKVGMLIVSWLAEAFEMKAIFKIEVHEIERLLRQYTIKAHVFPWLGGPPLMMDETPPWVMRESKADRRQSGVLDLIVLRILESRNQIIKGSDTNRTSVDDVRYNYKFCLQFEV